MNTRTAEQVCSRIKGIEMQVRRVPGTALANQATGDVIYTPPVGEDLLRTKLANWERYLHEQRDIDPLIRMAVGHYQFEAIHPFTDGNGRTGRILNSLFLIQEELLTLPILYLSALTITHVRQAAPKIYSRELVDLIFDLPYCRIQNLVERDIAGRQAASRYLKQLVEVGVLEEKTVGRDKLFIHPKLMHLLTRDDNAVTPYEYSE
ncbi:MAG: Fic family protein [Burkholderiales bacterium]